MRKVSKVLSATVVLSTLVVGSSAVPITNSSSDVQAAEKVQEWGHGEGGSGVSTESTADTQSQIPWYNYEGYTTYDPTFTLDYNFVRAMKYDNFTLNGYKANPKANQNHAYTVDSYGSQIDFNEKDQVIQMEFNTKPHAVTKAQFKKRTHQMIVQQKENLKMVVHSYLIIRITALIKPTLIKMVI